MGRFSKKWYRFQMLRLKLRPEYVCTDFPYFPSKYSISFFHLLIVSPNSKPRILIFIIELMDFCISWFYSLPDIFCLTIIITLRRPLFPEFFAIKLALNPIYFRGLWFYSAKKLCHDEFLKKTPLRFLWFLYWLKKLLMFMRVNIFMNDLCMLIFYCKVVYCFNDYFPHF